MNWMLNTKKLRLPGAREASLFPAGKGANIVWVDPEHDLVAVVRWIDCEQLDQFARLVVDAVQ